jgi:hypothetical protein
MRSSFERRRREVLKAGALLRRCLIALAASLALASCRSPSPLPPNKSEPVAVAPAPLALIPAPYLLKHAPGFFALHEGAALHVYTSNTEALGVASWFQELALRTRGVNLNLRPNAETNVDGDGGIDFVLDPQLVLPPRVPMGKVYK